MIKVSPFCVNVKILLLGINLLKSISKVMPPLCLVASLPNSVVVVQV